MKVIITDTDEVLENDVTSVKTLRSTKKELRDEKQSLADLKTKANARIDEINTQLALIDTEIAAGRAEDRRTPPPQQGEKMV